MKIMLSVVNYGHGTHLIQKKCERVGLYKNELAAASEAAKRAATAEETVTKKPRRRISDVVLPCLLCCRLQGESRIHK